MIAAGIDLGGTKIEAQLFDSGWEAVRRHRVATPSAYSSLVRTMADQMAWIEENAGAACPVGISAAGLIVPDTGLALTANLAANGHRFMNDLAEATHRQFTYVNDCRAFAQSEEVFGAGRASSTVLGLILGTGVGGGVVINQKLLAGHTGVGGEFGHLGIPGHLMEEFGLPEQICGCGRNNCFETHVSGPGLTKIAEIIANRSISPQVIAATKGSDRKIAGIWTIWTALVAELLLSLTFTFDPEIIVLGGGLSRIDGVAEDLTNALVQRQFSGFKIPEIQLAQGGDASGARGAAFAAWQSSRGTHVPTSS